MLYRTRCAISGGMSAADMVMLSVKIVTKTLLLKCVTGRIVAVAADTLASFEDA